jgi:hypothetical protein
LLAAYWIAASSHNSTGFPFTILMLVSSFIGPPVLGRDLKKVHQLTKANARQVSQAIEAYYARQSHNPFIKRLNSLQMSH